MRPVLRAFLQEQPTLALGTAALESGSPQVTPLFFASDDDLNLYWISDPDSRHSANLRDWNDAAAAIFGPTWDWAGIKSVQFEGDAMAVIADDERQRAQALFTAKFSFASGKFEEMMDQCVFYVLRPRWIRWLDNARRFGYTQEFALPDTTSE